MTEPRLDEALKRAAELADAYDKAGTSLGWIRARQSVLGWAEAVEAMHRIREACEALSRNNELRVHADRWKPLDQIDADALIAITKFCDAMLGGDDA